ncbi:hypothetical protein Droror1_Dr00026370 [Drosera rotundifolia]
MEGPTQLSSSAHQALADCTVRGIWSILSRSFPNTPQIPFLHTSLKPHPPHHFEEEEGLRDDEARYQGEGNRVELEVWVLEWVCAEVFELVRGELARDDVDSYLAGFERSCSWLRCTELVRLHSFFVKLALDFGAKELPGSVGRDFRLFSFVGVWFRE